MLKKVAKLLEIVGRFYIKDNMLDRHSYHHFLFILYRVDKYI